MGLAAADLGRELAEAAAPGTVVSGPPAEARSVAGVRPRFLVEPTTVTGAIDHRVAMEPVRRIRGFHPRPWIGDREIATQ